MRGFMHLLIRFRVLPRNRWLFEQARRLLFQPIHPRDSGQVRGVIDLGSGVGPESADYFKHWWEQMDG
jgi:hypothetical protein